MATHGGRIIPRPGAEQEPNIPLYYTSYGYTEFSVIGKSLGLASFEPTKKMNPALLRT